MYFTGDIVDHGVWETNVKKNAESLNKTYLQIQKTFENVPVYPILGNHEPHPVNQWVIWLIIQIYFIQILSTITLIPAFWDNIALRNSSRFAPTSITDEISTHWLYSMMADLWIDFGWLPNSTRSTILNGGYYTVSPKKGFRIIALNNNICYNYNWWVPWFLTMWDNGQFIFIIFRL